MLQKFKEVQRWIILGGLRGDYSIAWFEK